MEQFLLFYLVLTLTTCYLLKVLLRFLVIPLEYRLQGLWRDGGQVLVQPWLELVPVWTSHCLNRIFERLVYTRHLDGTIYYMIPIPGSSFEVPALWTHWLLWRMCNMCNMWLGLGLKMWLCSSARLCIKSLKQATAVYCACDGLMSAHLVSVIIYVGLETWLVNGVLLERLWINPLFAVCLHFNTASSLSADFSASKAFGDGCGQVRTIYDFHIRHFSPWWYRWDDSTI